MPGSDHSARRGARSMLFCGRYPISAAREVERLRLAGRQELRHAAHLVVDARATEALEVDLLVRHRLHDVRPGDEHVARAVHHDDEVGDRGRVDGAAGTRSHHQRDLRHHAGCQRVAEEDVGVASQAGHTFLDPRATRIGEADDRRTVLEREVHHLADLFGVGLRQRPTEHREVLAVDEDEPPIDLSRSGDDAITEVQLVLETELARAMRHERVELREGPFVEEQVEPLARRQLSARVLLLDSFLSPTQTRLIAKRAKSLELVGGRHGTDSLAVRCWWARQESNLRPSGYEPVALTIELRARRTTVDNFEYRPMSLHNDTPFSPRCGQL